MEAWAESNIPQAPTTLPAAPLSSIVAATAISSFPNRGKIDTRRSITLLAWIYHTGRAGPIFNYMPNGWGVHFWMVTPKTLFARFMRRGRRRFTAAVSSRSVRPRKMAICWCNVQLQDRRGAFVL